MLLLLFVVSSMAIKHIRMCMAKFLVLQLYGFLGLGVV